MTYELFGFGGKQGVGKNYIAEKIFIPKLQRKNTLVMAFGDHFKVDTCTKYNRPYESVFINKDFETRKILQITGTEEGRNKYGQDIWINTVDTWMRVYSERGIERFVITDIRFPNELEFIKSKGGTTIKIEAPNRNMTKLLYESGGCFLYYDMFIGNILMTICRAC